MRINGRSVRPRALRRLAAAATVATTLSFSMIGNASAQTVAMADPVMVTVDQAIVLRLDEPAAAIVVGNAAIADATIVDTLTMVITGRSYGTTNLIVLGANGQVLTDQLITVQSAVAQLTVYRRSIRQTYSCTPICAPTLNVGDNGTLFEETNDQIQARAALALSD